MPITHTSWQKALVAPALALILASCQDNAATVQPTTTKSELTVTVQGVPEAKITVAGPNGKTFEGTVKGSKTISALPRAKYTVTAASITGFNTPAPQEVDLTDGEGTISLMFSDTRAGRIEGRLRGWQARANSLLEVSSYSSNGWDELGSATVTSEGDVVLPILAAPERPDHTFFQFSEQCDANELGETPGLVFAAADRLQVVDATSRIQVGSVQELTESKNPEYLSYVSRIYASSPGRVSGSVTCTVGEFTEHMVLDLNFAAGWNMIQVSVSHVSEDGMEGTLHVTNLPAAAEITMLYRGNGPEPLVQTSSTDPLMHRAMPPFSYFSTLWHR